MNVKWKDVLERVAWTAIQAFAGVIAALQITDNMDWKTVLYTASIAAIVAAAKALVAMQFGNPDSAALPETRP